MRTQTVLTTALLTTLILVGPAAAQTGGGDGGGTASAPAADASPDRHPVHRVRAEVEVDGVLDEAAWSRARPIRLPLESSPGRNAEAPVETVCRVAHDADHLYLGCRASDPEPGSIRAHLADRDTPFDDDWIRVLLDPFSDRRQAYEFRVNPLGVQMDALYRQGRSSFSWDGIWASDGRITEEGYVVEAAVPFRSMNFPETEGPQEWGVVFSRSWPRSEVHRLRSIETDYREQCLLCQAERLTGLRPGASGHGVELNPTLTTTRTDSRPQLTSPSVQDGAVEMEPGLTGSWRFASNFQVSGTVNPDFSQVEADAARLRTNRRFALFFPEKRPFFLERSDIFQMPANLIFTRSVVDPQAGVKLTGKQGGNTLGAFATRDRVTSLIFPGPTSSSQTLLEQEVTGFVGRWQRDVGSSSTVSLAATDREGEGYHNRLLVSDGNLRLGASTNLVFLAAGSHTEYPPAVARAFGQPTGGFGGYLGAASVAHGTRNWNASATVVDIGPDFRADAGFLPQAGLRRAGYFLQRRIWTPDLSWATRFELRSDGRYDVDHQGELVRRSTGLEAAWRGPLQSELLVEWDWDEERFAGETFSLPTWGVSGSVEPSGALELGADLTAGKEIDFTNARRAELLRFGPRVEWRAGRHLSFEASHDLERLSRGGETFLEENVTELRARWHFSKEAFLRAIVQHRDVSQDPAAFGGGAPEGARSLFGQFLFTYELDPRTALFVGYTDTRQGLEANRRDIDLRQTRRTFFMKMSYSWRF